MKKIFEESTMEIAIVKRANCEQYFSKLNPQEHVLMKPLLTTRFELTIKNLRSQYSK
jgi:hypothetical protein